MPESLDAEARDKRTTGHSIPGASRRPPGHRRWLHSRRWVKGLVSMLVVAAIIGAAFALIWSHVSPRFGVSPATGSDTWVGGVPVTRHAEAGGLDFVMQVTSGPYFLGELLAANLSLRNVSRTTYTYALDCLGEPPSGVFLAMTGTSRPQDVRPQPLNPVPCVGGATSTLAPGETMTRHEFLPVSYSGEVTLQSGAHFVAGQGPDQSSTARFDPLFGLWPSLTISVAAATPADRRIALRQEGSQVQITAPAAARAHLYYMYMVSCNNFPQGGTLQTGRFAWEPISTPVVQEPDCGIPGLTIEWWYVVGAPGYAIASGQGPGQGLVEDAWLIALVAIVVIGTLMLRRIWAWLDVVIPDPT